MKSREEVIQCLSNNFLEIKARFHVRRLGIFGSYARQENDISSDVDILVEYSETPDIFQFMDLEDYLCELLGIKVDLVTVKALKPMMKSDILKEVIYV